MHASRLAKVSCYSGLVSIAVFVLATLLLQIFPPAPGYKSAAYSEVGGLLLLLSTVSGLLGVVALVAGVKALRRFQATTPKSQKTAAWVGVATGGAYVAMMVLPVMVWWALT